MKLFMCVMKNCSQRSSMAIRAIMAIIFKLETAMSDRASSPDSSTSSKVDAGRWKIVELIAKKFAWYSSGRLRRGSDSILLDATLTQSIWVPLFSDHSRLTYTVWVTQCESQLLPEKNRNSTLGWTLESNRSSQLSRTRMILRWSSSTMKRVLAACHSPKLRGARSFFSSFSNLNKQAWFRFKALCFELKAMHFEQDHL